MTSAWRPKAAQSTKQTSSRSSPSGALNFRFMARPNSVTMDWVGSCLVTGSRVRFPTMMTLFTLGMDLSPWRVVVGCQGVVVVVKRGTFRDILGHLWCPIVSAVFSLSRRDVAGEAVLHVLDALVDGLGGHVL